MNFFEDCVAKYLHFLKKVISALLTCNSFESKSTSQRESLKLMKFFEKNEESGDTLVPNTTSTTL